MSHCIVSVWVLNTCHYSVIWCFMCEPLYSVCLGSKHMSLQCYLMFYVYIWVGSWKCTCLVTWFHYQMIEDQTTRQAHIHDLTHIVPGGRFKNTYELLNLRALKFSYVNEIHIFQCMGKIFCVEFQRVPLKFHTKYLTHTLKDMIFIQHGNFKSS